MQSFEGKTVFITGASAGIGLALSQEFAHQKARVVLTARRKDRLDQAVQELVADGHSALGLSCDVTQEGSVEKAVSATLETYKKIDIVIANAGFGVVGRFDQLTLNDYRRQFETNIWGVLRTIYATLPELKKTKGTLVLLGSVSGYISLPGSSPYGMSKFAIHALASSLRGELRECGVSVVLIAPGFVVSEIRQVDNLGKYHPEASESIPHWLPMSTKKAARKIVKAIGKRKGEEVITSHGKILVFLKRHCPWFLTGLIKLGLKGRSEP